MKKLIALLLLCAATSYGATVQRISISIMVSNTPVTSNTLTINAATRTWTNTSSSLYIPTNLISTALATTNLANNLAAFPLAGALTFQWISSTNFRLIAPLGSAFSASSVGGWAVISTTNQAGPPTFTALWPLENMAGDVSNRVNQASSLVYGEGIYSTNAYPTNATAVSNHLHKGAGPRQRVLSEVEYQTLLAAAFAQLTNANLVNATNSGYIAALTNGYWTNGIANNLTVTNLNAPGAGSLSQRLGDNSLANGLQSLALGQGTTALTNAGTAVGTASSAFGIADTALASGAEANGGNSIAIGPSSGTGATNAVALGARSLSVFQNSVAIANDSATTASNQVRLGTSSHFVSIPGVLAIDGTQTNTVFDGTNKFNYAISKTVSNITSLANGVNLVDPGFRSYVVISGPTLAYSLDKLTRGYDGREIEFEKQDSLTMTIADESGSAGGAVTDRIRTGTGASVTLTNNPGSFALRYNASLGRWVLKWKTN